MLNLEKLGWNEGAMLSIRYALQDFDDSKSGVQADSDVLNIDLFNKFTKMRGLYIKFRFGMARGDRDTKDIRGQVKPDPSYKEFRFEVNYLF